MHAWYSEVSTNMQTQRLYSYRQSTSTCWCFSPLHTAVIPCPALDSPVNGTVDDADREYQSVATYSCDPGFNLDGAETRTCQSDGTWSGQPPTCSE